MRAPRPPRRGAALATRACIAGALAVAAQAAPAAAAIPPPCGAAQITDAAGDGHHDNTDVTAAWLAEADGRLQAVIRPRAAVWEPVHDDSDAAGFAFLYTAGGATRYVRAEAPRGAPVRFDHGTWTLAGGFASDGPTAGEAVAGPGGAVAIDLPAVPAGTVLARPFALTYDGATGTAPHWVDRAPGGVDPAGTEVGADFVAGSCAAPGPGGTPLAAGRRRRPRPRSRWRRRGAWPAAAGWPSAGASRRPAPAWPWRSPRAPGAPSCGAPSRRPTAPSRCCCRSARRRACVPWPRASARRPARSPSSRRCGCASAHGPAAPSWSGRRPPAPARPGAAAPPRRRRADRHRAGARRALPHPPGRPPARVATRPSSSRAARAPSGPLRSLEPSDDLAPPRRAPSPPPRSPSRPRPPRTRRSTRTPRA